MNNYKGFTELDCYKNGRELRKSISALAATFPKGERYELVSQIKRSSRSITANIAEGYGRYTYSDTRHFFVISRGSVTETMEHLTTAFDENYISEDVLKAEFEKCEIIFKLINGFIAYLDRSKKTQKAALPNS
jgi:four helix bundle protein